MQPVLELYFFPSCPYCKKVLNVITDLKIQVIYKNIDEDAEALTELMRVTGRRTVPCLFIDKKPMHESQDIMNWLKTNCENLAKQG